MKFKNNQKGNSTIEIIIAFAVLSLAMTAIIVIGFSNQSIGIDGETSNEAIYKAEELIENAKAKSQNDFFSINSEPTTTIVSTIPYYQKQDVIDESECKKYLKEEVYWNSGNSREQRVELNTFLSNTKEMLALGSDCIIDEPNSNWSNPQIFSSETLLPSHPTSIDVLSSTAYVGLDTDPYLYIQGGSPFANSFTATNKINSLDAIYYPASQKYYLFAAMDSATNQLEVIDVTDPHNPLLVATRSLSPCVAGSAPQGWRVFYYEAKIYFTTRFTAGPEFHIFDVADPTNPLEYAIGSSACKGFDLGDTANSISARNNLIYLATDESDKELKVLDVSNPLSPYEMPSANQNLPGVQNGLSVYIIGNKLYLGRQSVPSGPDLYVYDISNPSSGLPLIGSQDIGTGILNIKVAGDTAFLATPKSGAQFQTWDISSTTDITNIKKYNFGNIADESFEYDGDKIYAGGSAGNLVILYNP